MKQNAKIPPVISIVGKSNSGKTTLIEKVIFQLKQRGCRVGAIKHDVHKFEIDHEGKDTYKMTKAGADTVAIASDKKIAMVKNINEERSIDEIVENLFQDTSIVVTEGYKRQNKPKIEVTRTGELLCNKDEGLIAVVFNPAGDATPAKALEFIHAPEDHVCKGVDEWSSGAGFQRNPEVKDTTDGRRWSFITQECHDLNVPCFKIDDVKQIVDLIEEKFLSKT